MGVALYIGCACVRFHMNIASHGVASRVSRFISGGFMCRYVSVRCVAKNWLYLDVASHGYGFTYMWHHVDLVLDIAVRM